MSLGAKTHSGIVCSRTGTIIPTTEDESDATTIPHAQGPRELEVDGGLEAEEPTDVVTEGGARPTGESVPPPRGQDGDGLLQEQEPSRAAKEDADQGSDLRPTGEEFGPRSPSPRPNYARLRALIAPWATQVAAGLGVAAGMTPAEAAQTTLTCTALEQGSTGGTESPGWIATTAAVVLAAVALSAFILGRWSAPRKGAEPRIEAKPWVMITEARERSPQEVRGLRIPEAGSGTKEVASQAPCTYAVVRGHARGRFLPLPESAHG